MSDPTILPEGADETLPEAKTDEQKSVSYESHRQILAEKKKLQQRVRDFEEAEKKRQEDLLQAEGKHKEMLDLKSKEALELRQQLDLRDERDMNAKKMASLLKGLGSGVEEKWYDIISLHIDEIPVDDNKEIDHAAVSKIVNKLKTTWPEMTKKPVVGVPTGQPTGSATITYAEWAKLPAKEMQKYRPNQIV